ncbi:hypothetical protein AAG906_001796 [Vitis piasezkii]
MMASRLPRSLTAVYRVMMTLPPPRGIMTSQKVFPSLKREAELLTLYIRTFTQGGRVCPDTLSGHLLQGQLNQNSILVESVRPLGSYVDHRDARPQHWRRLWEIEESYLESMAKQWKAQKHEEPKL